MSTRATAGSPFDAGHRHTFTPRYIEGVLYGFGHTHPNPAGGTCQGWIPTSIGEAGWTLTEKDPPTLVPSLLCRDCGDHGWLTSGRWVPA